MNRVLLTLALHTLAGIFVNLPRPRNKNRRIKKRVFKTYYCLWIGCKVDECLTGLFDIGSDLPTAMKIAILTSGGDSAGMNAAVRSIVKYGILK